MRGLDSKIRRFRALQDLTGGEGGIRTHDTLARIPVFETGTFNRSDTSPVGRILPARRINSPVQWP